MRKICTYPGCNNVVEVDDFDNSSPRCPLHQVARVPKKRYAHHYHNNKNIYYSNQWKKLRARYVADHPLCEHCLKFDILTPVDVVDHIKEIKDGGDPFDYNNLQSLCNSCHAKKTLNEKRKRYKKGKSLSDF